MLLIHIIDNQVVNGKYVYPYLKDYIYFKILITEECCLVPLFSLSPT